MAPRRAVQEGLPWASAEACRVVGREYVFEADAWGGIVIESWTKKVSVEIYGVLRKVCGLARNSEVENAESYCLEPRRGSMRNGQWAMGIGHVVVEVEPEKKCTGYVIMYDHLLDVLRITLAFSGVP